MEFVLVNGTSSGLDLKGWSIWFNAIYPVLDTIAEDYEVINQKGNLFQLLFEKELKLEGKDSIVIQMESKYAINNLSAAPNGLYFQKNDDSQQAFDIKDYQIGSFKESNENYNKRLAALYEKNLKVQPEYMQLILPTPHSLITGEGEFSVNEALKYYLDPQLADREDQLKRIFGNIRSDLDFISSEDKREAELIVEHDTSLQKEAYILEIGENGVLIKASSYEGMFYALQTIQNLLPPSQLISAGAGFTLPYVQVKDQPRFSYRGLMLDIARNFHNKEVLLKYLDIMSLYKLNTLHLHFVDDEGWRIEIPSLPELTEIGSHRTAYFNDGRSIQPAYGSGINAGEGKYLSVEDFKEVLKYAAERCIKVIPEIETPGHARASIKAMEARYNRLVKEGNKEEAEKYLLHDPEDRSVYSSVQYFDDNVMDVARPSTYRFLSLVVDEIKQMYEDVGLKLETLHLGGDEVPGGAWEKSPSIENLMKEEGFDSVYQVWPYYINKVRNMLAEKGIEMAGWEEVGMVNKAEGMDVNGQLSKNSIQVDVWNNVIGAGQEDLAYRLANAGYKTVMVSASNFYLDMAWNSEFDEYGFKWASITDLYHSYSLLPKDYFANVHLADRAKPLAKDYFEDKVRLTVDGEKNLVGVKGTLWCETVLNAEGVDYMLLPRLFSVAERAWSPKRVWESEDSFDVVEFDKEYAGFVNKIGNSELHKLDLRFDNMNYRLPGIGVKETDGKLYVNTEYPGYAIHYTSDGDDPDHQSSRFDNPISVEEGKEYKFVVVAPNGRSGRIVTYKK